MRAAAGVGPCSTDYGPESGPWRAAGSVGRSSVGLRRAAARSSPGGQRGAMEGRSVGLRRSAAAWGCAGAQRAAA